MPSHAIIVKIDHMILSWFLAAGEGTREKLANFISSIRRSLEFLGPHSLESSGDHLRADV